LRKEFEFGEKKVGSEFIEGESRRVVSRGEKKKSGEKGPKILGGEKEAAGQRGAVSLVAEEKLA